MKLTGKTEKETVEIDAQHARAAGWAHWLAGLAISALQAT